jgi:hypothetical protein
MLDIDRLGFRLSTNPCRSILEGVDRLQRWVHPNEKVSRRTAGSSRSMAACPLIPQGRSSFQTKPRNWKE